MLQSLPRRSTSSLLLAGSLALTLLGAAVHAQGQGRGRGRDGSSWMLPLPDGPPDLSTFEAVDTALDGRALLPLGAMWRYFIGYEEPSAGLEWTRPEFDDSAWAQGPSGFGYGGEPENTDLSEMAGKATTLYLRHALVVDDPTVFTRIRLEVPMDDGMVFYLNGREEARQHADEPDKRLPHDATATSERKLDEKPVPIFDLTGKLVAGVNLLAIQGLVAEDDAKSMALRPRVWVLYRVREDEERARLEAFSRELTAPGDEARLAYLDGRHFQRTGHFEEALAPLFRAAQFDPGERLPWRRLAECHRELGRVTELEERLGAFLAAGVGTPALFDAWTSLFLEDLHRPVVELPAALPAAGSLPERGFFADALWAGRELAAGRALRVDAGADTERGENGATWTHDRFFACGSPLTREEPEAAAGREAAPAEAAAEVAEPYDATGRQPTRTLDQIDPLYRVPVPPGDYALRLQLAGGDHVFHVQVEGSTVERRHVSSGAETDTESLDVPVRVEDGFLDFDLIPIAAYFPIVLSFEVEPLSPERFAAEAERWCAESPGLALPLVQRAAAREQAGDLGGAVATLEQAAALPGFRPADAARLSGLRDALLPALGSCATVDDLVVRRADAEQVLEDVRAAADGEEAEQLALYFEGRLAQAHGHMDDAIAVFEELVFAGSHAPEPYVHMAECLRSVDLFPEALGIVHQALDAGVPPSQELLRIWFTLELDDEGGDPWDVIARLRELGIGGTLWPVPTSEYAAQPWWWTPFEPPVTTWSRAAYDYSAWNEGPGGLGSGLLVDAVPRTHWGDRRLFARRVFQLPARRLLYPHVRVHMDDAGEVYVNGKSVANISWNTLGYKLIPLRDTGLDAGENVLGMTGYNIRGEGFADAGIVEPLDDLYWVMDRLDEEGAIRMNCGGPELTVSDGRVFHADRFQGNGIAAASDEPRLEIAGTEDDELYRTYRWWYGTELRTNWYQVPLPDGPYRVTLHFCEVTPTAKEKPRSFNVFLENELVLEKLDVCATAGFATALVRSFDVDVADGWLDVDFRDKDSNAILSAIEIEVR